MNEDRFLGSFVAGFVILFFVIVGCMIYESSGPVMSDEGRIEQVQFIPDHWIGSKTHHEVPNTWRLWIDVRGLENYVDITHPPVEWELQDSKIKVTYSVGKLSNSLSIDQIEPLK